MHLAAIGLHRKSVRQFMQAFDQRIGQPQREPHGTAAQFARGLIGHRRRVESQQHRPKAASARSMPPAVPENKKRNFATCWFKNESGFHSGTRNDSGFTAARVR